MNCRGDAQFGPLLFVEGNKASVDLELLPNESKKNVHALATIHGNGHEITIKPSAAGTRSQVVPILLGYGQPMMGEGMAPIPERPAKKITLNNRTSMPVVIGAKAENSTVSSAGPILENKGKAITLKADAPAH